MRLSRGWAARVWSRCPSSQGCWEQPRATAFQTAPAHKIMMEYITHVLDSKPLLYCFNYNTNEVHWEELAHSIHNFKRTTVVNRGFLAFSIQTESKAKILILPSRRNIKLPRRQLCEKTVWRVLAGTASQRN